MPRRSQLPKTKKQTPKATASPRRSTRVKAGAVVRASAKKSRYFENLSDDEGGNQDQEDDDSDGANRSTFEDVNSAEDSTGFERESSDEVEDDDNDDDGKDRKPAKKRGRSSSGATLAKSTKKQKKLMPGAVLIPNRAPSPGDTEYADDRIHPNTLAFLRDLSNNNSRTWFSDHDSAYRAAKSDYDTFVGRMSKLMVEHVDDTIPELPLKDLLFRIYRDIRFSNDQTPYKTYFSAAWSRTGKKGPYACYYLSIQTGESFAGGGLWRTDAQPLSLLRREIDKNARPLKKVLAGAEFAEEFFGADAVGDESRAVKGFAEKNKDDALKTAPKNYPKDHKDIELLRLRSFAVGKRLTDEEVIAINCLDRIAEIFKKMEPFISYLNSVVMPDINADDGSNGDSDGD